VQRLTLPMTLTSAEDLNYPPRFLDDRLIPHRHRLSEINVSQCICEGLVASAAAAAAAATTAATAVAAATSAPSTTTTATAATAIFAGSGFIDRQRPTVVILAVEPPDGRLSLLVVAHFDEAETLAAAALAVLNDLGTFDRAERSKQRFQLGAGDAIAQVSNIQLLAQNHSPLGGHYGPLTTRAGLKPKTRLTD